MTNKKEYYLDLLKITLVIFCCVTLLFLPAFLQGKYYVGGGDVRTQTFPFYVLYKKLFMNLLSNHTLPFYSFSNFLGTNMWGSQGFYGYFDIYTILSYFINANFFVVNIIMLYIRLILSGITFYIYGRYVFKKKEWVVTGSILYALSNYMIYFISVPYFLSFLSLFPLYLLGMDKYIKENKGLLFLFVTGILLMNNYYLFFTISVFSPMYFIYKYYNLHSTLKGFFVSALKLVGYYLVGVMLVGIIFIPELFYILKNERVGYNNMILFYKDIKVYLHGLIASFVPTNLSIYDNNIFNQDAHSLKELCIYSSALVPLVIPQVFVNKDKVFKYSTLILFVVLYACLFIPIGSSIMHGFSAVAFRWTFLITFVSIITFIHIMQDVVDIKVLLYSLCSIIMIIIGCFVGVLIIEKADLGQYKVQMCLYGTVIGLFVLYSYLLSHNHTKAIQILIIAELVCMSVYKGYISLDVSQDKDQAQRVVTVLEDESDQLNNYLHYLNGYDEFYRTYIQYDELYWAYSRNLNMIYDLNGLMGYSSTYAPSFNDMKAMAYGEIVNIIDWDYEIRNKDLMNFLNTKYSITVSEEAIPFENYTIVDNNYRENLIIAQNNDYRCLGTTYKDITLDKDVSKINDYVLSSSEDFDEIQSFLKSKNVSSMTNINYGDNHVYGDIESDDESFMVISLPYDEGWKILVNGQQSKVYKVNGGMMGVSINPGYNHIEMYMVPKGVKEGALLSALGLVITLGLIVFSLIKRRRI